MSLTRGEDRREASSGYEHLTCRMSIGVEQQGQGQNPRQSRSFSLAGMQQAEGKEDQKKNQIQTLVIEG